MELYQILITLGVLLFLGFVTDGIGRLTRLPRVTLLLLFGILIGPSILDLLPKPIESWFPIIADIALSMVGFLLGGQLTRESLQKLGRLVLWISFFVVFATAVSVFIGLLALGTGTVIALLLGGVAPATDPAATAEVVKEVKSKGKFSRTLLSIVTFDDVWGLIMFSAFLSIAQFMNGHGANLGFLTSVSWEIGGALLLGVALGIPMAYLTGRIKSGEPTLIEALSLILLCSGLALWMEVSFLIASMTLGAVIANLAKHHDRPFHAIEEIESPFIILFFILAGSTLQFKSLLDVGLIGGAYIVLRIIGRIVGAWLGGSLAHAETSIKKWMGVALMPQAGVAIGMTLVAIQRFPELRETILPVVLSSTVFFELLGPILTKFALTQVNKLEK